MGLGGINIGARMVFIGNVVKADRKFKLRMAGVCLALLAKRVHRISEESDPQSDAR